MISNPSTRKTLPASGRVIGLRDIAADLNVSISLVSKVLSGRLGNSGANRDLIQAIHAKAEELSYRKNRLAEALRTGRQNVIGVMVHRHGVAGGAIVDEMVSGIADEAGRQGQRLMLQFYETLEQFRTFSSSLRPNEVDGVIMGGLPHPELIHDLTAIHASGVPVVTIHDYELNPAFPNVGMDQSEVTRLAMLHLIDACGCRRIATFNWSGDNVQSLMAMRHNGYLAGLNERGLSIDPALNVSVVDFAYQTGFNATRELLARGVQFDAILGLSDEHAAGALNALTLAGKLVPQDVKVIGIDNAPICQCAIVPLSSVSQEFRIRGQMAVAQLMNAGGDRPWKSVYVPPVVCARVSTCP